MNETLGERMYETLNEIIDTNLVCDWKIIQQDNDIGEGTSFTNNYNIPCRECTGFNYECNKYTNRWEYDKK